jgi:hypothetical protein
MVVAVLIVVLGFLSFGIWIYQAIILPSIRQRLRFELFCLRDQTRKLVIDGCIKEDSAVFRHLHRQLNVMIKAIPWFDFVLVTDLEVSNPELKARAEKSIKLIEGSTPEVLKIYHEAMKIMAFALIANSFVWFVGFSLPAFSVVVSQGVWKLYAAVRKRLQMKVRPAFGLREQDLILAL